jgi:16S rRNA (uracil1498-N3)-methyltransferase
MARRRFFVDEVRDGRAVLTGEDALHLAQVLRAEPGERAELSDNRSVYLAEIEAVRKGEVRFRILEELAAEAPAPRFTLFLALIKFDRLEWAIEKATELGAAAIVPVEAARSEKGLERAAAKRVERWRRIARESSQQARRARLPEIGAPLPLAQALAVPGYFLDEGGGPPLLSVLPERRTAADQIRLLVGPEGGWTDAERAAALQAGWTRAWLGPSILRAETAALAALAVLSSAWLGYG